MKPGIMEFPKGFLWGAATASYQVEGAVNQGGRGKTVWDTFCDRKGKINNNDSGERACDHYNRWKEDIKIMKELKLKSYRFSIAWSRIFPDGEGSVNQEGVDFYNNLIDGLIEAGIKPAITLFHWDLPQSLQDKYGGWKSRRVSELFADYARFCGKTYGDRVKMWFTINEISCFTTMAHDTDYHAPGGKEEITISNRTIHNALLGHGLAVRALREVCAKDSKIGIVENLVPPWPVIDTEENIKAQQQAFYDMNQVKLFPLMTGKYDEKVYSHQRVRKTAPEYTQEDMEIISTPIDFLAYNIYQGPAIRAAENEFGWELVNTPKGHPKTNMDWAITPKCIYWAIMNTKHFFGDIPVYIAENGMAAQDKEEENGEILDLDRMEYMRAHLEMCGKSIQDGGNLKGYFAWSLMDNFEWTKGYSKRFGLVRVNYRTMERTIKLSGEYYRKIIQDNGV
ncbi:MAG: GH1 family beta-glucosidase [Spirochaetaceae bacterium]|jgi:beta-glucosidase|nr:GH1 family beta-glucosidase [Spirochaetaceae bacterium]